MKIVKNHKFVFCIAGLLLLFISGCASNPKINGNGDLCGFVIDEKNQAVENYVISARHNGGLWRSTVTNKQGMFIFPDSSLGNYSFKGEKSCFVNLKEQNYLFSDKSKVYCFQINSIDEALNNIEKMILCDEYEQAVSLLSEINVEKKTSANRVVSVYREFLKQKIAEKKKKEKMKKNESKENLVE